MSKLAFDNIVLDISPNGSVFAIQLDDQAHQVEVLDVSNGLFDLLVDGRQYAAYVSADGQSRWVTINGRTFLLGKSITSGRMAAAHESSSELPAPMPGQIRTVNVSAGDTVSKGQVLLILEAMKMEIRIQAPFNGQVLSVNVAVGQTVSRDQILINLHRA